MEDVWLSLSVSLRAFADLWNDCFFPWAVFFQLLLKEVALLQLYEDTELLLSG